MQPDNNDHEALEPHTHVHGDRNDKYKPKRMPAPFEPEDLRHQNITTDHKEPRPLIRPQRAIQEMEALIGIAAVPRDEKLHSVGVADNRTSGQRDFAHYIDVPHGDQVL